MSTKLTERQDDGFLSHVWFDLEPDPPMLACALP